MRDYDVLTLPPVRSVLPGCRGLGQRGNEMNDPLRPETFGSVVLEECSGPQVAIAGYYTIKLV